MHDVLASIANGEQCPIAQPPTESNTRRSASEAPPADAVRRYCEVTARSPSLFIPEATNLHWLWAHELVLASAVYETPNASITSVTSLSWSPVGASSHDVTYAAMRGPLLEARKVEFVSTADAAAPRNTESSKRAILEIDGSNGYATRLQSKSDAVQQASKSTRQMRGC